MCRWLENFDVCSTIRLYWHSGRIDIEIYVHCCIQYFQFNIIFSKTANGIFSQNLFKVYKNIQEF